MHQLMLQLAKDATPTDTRVTPPESRAFTQKARLGIPAAIERLKINDGTAIPRAPKAPPQPATAARPPPAGEGSGPRAP